jgi:anti-sigma regulatory factor (Ser/Thr protein kinase)
MTMNWSQTFPASRASAREARAFSEAALGELNEAQRSAIALVVSELAANAVLHAESPFTVSIELSDSAVTLEVTDHGRGTPVLRSPGIEESNGRGLQIVEFLADSWHIENGDAGTVVRVVINLDTDVWRTRSSGPSRRATASPRLPPGGGSTSTSAGPQASSPRGLAA